MMFSGCDNGGPSTAGQYTVTFDSDGGDPGDFTATASEGGTVSLPYPAPEKAGFDFGGWYTAVNGGGTEFTAETPVTADITLYAKWTPSTPAFVPGTPAVEGNTIVHQNPAITAYNGNAATVNADGSVTLNGGGGFSYAFPSGLSLNWKDCSTIKIEYVVTVAAGAAKLIVKDGVASFDDIGGTGNKYPTLETGEAKNLIYDVSAFAKSADGSASNGAGVSFQFNSDQNTDGNFTVTVTRVVFTKIEAGADYTVDLTGKTVKNEEAWAGAYQGFVISLDLPGTFDYGSYSKLTVEGTCYNSSSEPIAAGYGNGQIKLLKNAIGFWDGENLIIDQPNLGVQTNSISIGLNSVPGGLVVQNSKDTVAFIEITLIKFHN
jgi:uncharacterized repeat protein (TIGR02543 family)